MGPIIEEYQGYTIAHEDDSATTNYSYIQVSADNKILRRVRYVLDPDGTLAEAVRVAKGWIDQKEAKENWQQRLFDHMSTHHGLTLLNDELQSIHDIISPRTFPYNL